jgi:hypothetical protein
VLVTWELGREIDAPRKRTLGSTLLAATLAATAILLALAGLSRLEGAERATAIVGAGFFAAGALVAVTAAVCRRPRWAYGAAAGATAAFLATAVIVLFPAIGASNSAAPLVDAVPELTGGRPVATVDVRVPSLTFYLDRKTELLDMHELEPRLASGDRPLLVMVDVDLPAVPPSTMLRLREIGRHGKYRVFEERQLDAPQGPG